MDADGNPIQRARVELLSDNNMLALTRLTDNLGNAVIKIDEAQAGEIGELLVSADNYKSYRQYLNLEKNRLPVQVILESVTSGSQSQAVINEGAEEVVVTSQPTPIYTPLLTSTDIPTVQPTETATPTATFVPPTIAPTPTVTPTSTNTPTLMPPEQPRVKVVAGNIYVLTGPDTGNLAIGTFLYQEEGKVVGKTERGEWLEIIAPDGKQGWVASCQIELISGDLANVPQSWPGSVTPLLCDGTIIPPPPSCLTAVIERQQSTLPVNTVVIQWQNIPVNAAYYTISVYTITNTSGKAYVKELDRADFGTPNYTIGDWEFDLNHIASGTPFIFDVTVYDAANNVICTFSGNFTA